LSISSWRPANLKTFRARLESKERRIPISSLFYFRYLKKAMFKSLPNVNFVKFKRYWTNFMNNRTHL
jgi:hypothetical protein